MVDRYNIVLCNGNLHNKKEISSFEKRSMFQLKVDHSIKVGCYLFLSYIFLIPCSLFLDILASLFCNGENGVILCTSMVSTCDIFLRYWRTLDLFCRVNDNPVLDFWWHLSWNRLSRFVWARHLPPYWRPPSQAHSTCPSVVFVRSTFDILNVF